MKSKIESEDRRWWK